MVPLRSRVPLQGACAEVLFELWSLVSGADRCLCSGAARCCYHKSCLCFGAGLLMLQGAAAGCLCWSAVRLIKTT